MPALAAFQRHRNSVGRRFRDRDFETKDSVEVAQYFRLGREHLNRRKAAAARGGLCRVFAVHPVNEEWHERAEAMIVNPKTFPAKPFAIGKTSASGHQITAGEARGTCPLAQFNEINAANGPMIKPFAYELRTSGARFVSG